MKLKTTGLYLCEKVRNRKKSLSLVLQCVETARWRANINQFTFWISLLVNIYLLEGRTLRNTCSVQHSAFVWIAWVLSTYKVFEIDSPSIWDTSIRFVKPQPHFLFAIVTARGIHTTIVHCPVSTKPTCINQRYVQLLNQRRTQTYCWILPILWTQTCSGMLVGGSACSWSGTSKYLNVIRSYYND